jgi:flagella basal body P-ring formation protein FlgA
VLVKARQRVEVSINSGGLKLIMAGVAQQDGRLGQSVPVVNPDGRAGPDGRPHTVVARVVGPGRLELELGGTTP